MPMLESKIDAWLNCTKLFINAIRAQSIVVHDQLSMGWKLNVMSAKIAVITAKFPIVQILATEKSAKRALVLLTMSDMSESLHQCDACESSTFASVSTWKGSRSEPKLLMMSSRSRCKQLKSVFEQNFLDTCDKSIARFALCCYSAVIAGEEFSLFWLWNVVAIEFSDSCTLHYFLINVFRNRTCWVFWLDSKLSPLSLQAEDDALSLVIVKYSGTLLVSPTLSILCWFNVSSGTIESVLDSEFTVKRFV